MYLQPESKLLSKSLQPYLIEKELCIYHYLFKANINAVWLLFSGSCCRDLPSK